VIGFINARNVVASANDTVNRSAFAFAKIGNRFTICRAGLDELAKIFWNTGWTLFLTTSMSENGFKTVLDGSNAYAAIHVDEAKAKEITSWKLILKKTFRVRYQSRTS
jgi:hypothetical protein